jgi:hypothetical protein
MEVWNQMEFQALRELFRELWRALENFNQSFRVLWIGTWNKNSVRIFHCSGLSLKAEAKQVWNHVWRAILLDNFWEIPGISEVEG